MCSSNTLGYKLQGYMYEMNRQTNIKHIHVSTSELSIINRPSFETTENIYASAELTFCCEAKPSIF